MSIMITAVCENERKGDAQMPWHASLDFWLKINQKNKKTKIISAKFLHCDTINFFQNEIFYLINCFFEIKITRQLL